MEICFIFQLLCIEYPARSCTSCEFLSLIFFGNSQYERVKHILLPYKFIRNTSSWRYIIAQKYMEIDHSNEQILNTLSNTRIIVELRHQMFLRLQRIKFSITARTSAIYLHSLYIFHLSFYILISIISVSITSISWKVDSIYQRKSSLYFSNVTCNRKNVSSIE